MRSGGASEPRNGAFPLMQQRNLGGCEAATHSFGIKTTSARTKYGIDSVSGNRSQVMYVHPRPSL